MGHSRTPTHNTAGDGFPADPIDGSGIADSLPECVTATATESDPDRRSGNTVDS